MSENFSLLHSLDPRINTAKGTYTFQMMKVFASKFEELETIMTDLMDSLSIGTSVGFELDYHGVEAGIYRKAASRATCKIKVTGPANDFLIPLGSMFSTRSGVAYQTTVVAILPKTIVMVKGLSEGTDAVPYPYSGVTSISWINTTPSQTGDEYAENTDWTFDGDVITWLGEAEPPSNSQYFIGLEVSESVSVSISVVAMEPGSINRVTTGMLTENTGSLSGVSSVINEEDSLGGNDVENDIEFRNRLLKMSRTQFGYDRIRFLVSELEFVRACNIYQDTGVDLAFPVADWDASGTWTTFETQNLYSTNQVDMAQTFIPSQGIISIAKVSLYVQRVGRPEALNMSLYAWKTDYTTTVETAPLYSKNFTRDNVDPDHPTDWQEIQVKCRFGGLDYTKTYMIVASASGIATVDDHWKIKYQAAGDEYTDGGMYRDGSAVSNADIAFKTRWGGASFSIVVAMQDGEDFDSRLEEIETQITDFDKKAYTPICIQANIREATTAYINTTCTVYIDTASDWNLVKSMVRENIYNYLMALDPGSNVYFSSIEACIYNVPGVLKIVGCTIQKNSETAITKANEYDILISQDEIAVLGSPGTTLTQGVK